MLEQAGTLFSLIGKLLEVFQKKAFVYVDVCFGAESPYCLTVANESPFDVLLLNLQVAPDGFPDSDNGWQLNDSKIFKDKVLKPHQKIRLLLKNQDIAKHEKRSFRIEYCTLFKGKRIPRLQQVCEYEFKSKDHSVFTRKSVQIAWRILENTDDKTTENFTKS